jgi:DNA-binding CsgD family transcriptional regulator
VRDEAAAPAGGHAIALPAPGRSGFIATVLPLERGGRQRLSQPFAAAAAIFVQDPHVVPPLPGEAFAKLYGLSASELRIVLAMAPGLQPQEVADMLGISIATVKSHLAKIFSKTGTSRQSELTALMARLSTPAAAGV